MSLYRYRKVPSDLDSYLERIRKKFVNLSSAKPFSGSLFSLEGLYSKSEQFESFLYDSTFKRLLSALDIFLEIFPHEDSQLYRATTIVMRYEDCAMLGVLSSVARCISKPIPHAMMICFDPGAAKEMARMLEKETEEIVKQHSYRPYARSINIVSRSGYSVTLNKSFCKYYMLLLAALGDQRGRSGIQLADAPLALLTPTAVKLAYLLAGATEIGMYFGPEEEEESNQEGEDHGASQAASDGHSVDALQLQE